MLHEIGQEEFRNTMSSGMTDVTETGEPVVDIWPYVDMLAHKGNVSNYVVENNLVEKVYRSEDGKFDHVLLPTANENYFVVLVIDIHAESIIGYHPLNLNQLYT